MAKDSHGRVDRRSLRYMVHRHFLQKYHISIIGMEPLQVNSTSSAAETKLLAEMAPNFVRSLLEGASAKAGFSLEDTAALIAVIERLIEDSGHEHLEDSYKARGFDITELLTRDQLVDVMKHYMVRWFFGQDSEAIAEREQNRSLFEESMRWDWWMQFMDVAKSHIRTFEHQRLHALASGNAHGSGLKESWNPMRPLFSLADAQAVISGISAQFGRFWEPECEDLRQVLLRHDGRSTGRVALSSFYASALAGQWHFSESPAYLRSLGVLEEASLFHGPQVLASNYMLSANSCVVAQKHFRVCCANPCNDFYSDLEAAIGTPEGKPQDILAIVSNFTYGLDDAPPRITRRLRAQLQDIAQANRGRIPLHGRLFAQWLHFVFPTECPFPHKSGSTEGLNPRELGDGEALATVEEMRTIIRQGRERARANRSGVAGAGAQRHEDDDSNDLADLWSHEEELLSRHTQQAPRSTFSLRSTLRPVLYALATVSIFVTGALKPAMQVLGEANERGCAFGTLAGGRKRAISLGGAKSHMV